MDVAEGVGQEVEVAVLEDGDAAEVRRMDDHALGGSDAAKPGPRPLTPPSLSEPGGCRCYHTASPVTKGSHACRSSS